MGLLIDKECDERFFWSISRSSLKLQRFWSFWRVYRSSSNMWTTSTNFSFKFGSRLYFLFRKISKKLICKVIKNPLILFADMIWGNCIKKINFCWGSEWMFHAREIYSSQNIKLMEFTLMVSFAGKSDKTKVVLDFSVIYLLISLYSNGFWRWFCEIFSWSGNRFMWWREFYCNL